MNYHSFRIRVYLLKYLISIYISVLFAAPTFAQLPQYCDVPPVQISKSLPQSMRKPDWAAPGMPPAIYVITQLVVEKDGSTSNFRSEVFIDPPIGLTGVKEIFKQDVENLVGEWKYIGPSERCLHIDVTKKQR